MRATCFLSAFVLSIALLPVSAKQFAQAKSRADDAFHSVYTSLHESKCRDLTTQTMLDEQSSASECPGVAGYNLRQSEGDMRQTLDILTPGGKTYPLDLYSVVSAAPSYVGDMVEWRGHYQGPVFVPHALIVRYVVQTDAEDWKKTASKLVVSKITADTACVTDIVPSKAKANEQARQSADEARNKPCREHP